MEDGTSLFRLAHGFLLIRLLQDVKRQLLPALVGDESLAIELILNARQWPIRRAEIHQNPRAHPLKLGDAVEHSQLMGACAGAGWAQAAWVVNSRIFTTTTAILAGISTEIHANGRTRKFFIPNSLNCAIGFRAAPAFHARWRLLRANPQSYRLAGQPIHSVYATRDLQKDRGDRPRGLSPLGVCIGSASVGGPTIRDTPHARRCRGARCRQDTSHRGRGPDRSRCRRSPTASRRRSQCQRAQRPSTSC